MMFLSLGLGTSVQTSFMVNWWSSSSIAMVQSLFDKASSIVCGSILDTRMQDATSLNDDLVLTPSI